MGGIYGGKGGGGWEQERVIKRKGGAVGTTVERECYTDQESSTFEVSGFERRLKKEVGIAKNNSHK